MCSNVRNFFVLAVVFCIFTTSTEASKKDDMAAYIRSKVAQEESYEFGTDREFVLQDDKAILLKCSDNVDGIHEVLICLTDHFFNSRSIYIYCVGKGGISGGGSPLEHRDRAVRVREKCAVVAEWSEEKESLGLKFVLTDDRKYLTQKFKKFLKKGRYSNSGPWQNVVDKNELKLNADERIEIFVRLWTEVKYNFANFDLVPELNWDDVLSEYLPKVMQEQSNKDFAKLLVKCIARLKDGHTDIKMKFYEIFDQAQPALIVRLIEGKAIITEVGDGKDIAKANLKVGDEILKIDKKDVKEILDEEIYPYIFASTDQWRDKKAFRYLLRGPENSKINLRLKSIEGKHRDIILVRNLDWGKDMPRKEHTDFEYKNIGDRISYVAINTFRTSKVVDKFREHIKSIYKSKGLIIDVRKNGGGNSSNGDAIIAQLIDKAIPGTRWKTPQYRAAFRAWGSDEKWYDGGSDMINPGTDAPFLRPIVVLIGPETNSAAEDFVVPLHAAGRAILVGGKTSGSTGQPLRFDLGYGVNGRICTKRDIYPDGREFVGVGIIPGVEVHPTQTDIAAGRDVVLERGIEVLMGYIAKSR